MTVSRTQSISLETKAKCDANRGIHAPWRRLLPVGGMSAVAATLPPIGGLLILGALPALGPWLHDLGWGGIALYLLGFVVFAGLALLPTYAQAMLGGWAFGFAWGFPAALLGFAGGSMLAYRLSRSIARDRLIQTIERRPRWNALHRALIDAGFWKATLLVALVRLPPTSPFALTNVLMASAQVAWLPYLLGTVLGLAPRTAIAVFAAAGLSRFDLDQPATSESNWTIIFGIGSTVLVFLVIGLLARRTLRRLAGPTEGDTVSANRK